MKTMLIATDFSAAANNAAHYAAALAAGLGLERVLLYHATAGQASDHLAGLINTLTTDLQQILGASVMITTEINSISLLKGIRLLVKTHHADMVVVGLTGENKLGRLLMGSNTARLLGSCPVPLLVIPADCVFQSVKRIAFACDFRNITQDGPYVFIKDFASRLGAELMIVNVVSGGEPDDDFWKADEVLHTLFDPAGATYHYTGDMRVEHGIRSFADANEAQLVIVIAKGTRGFFSWQRHRSVIGKLTFMADLPTVIVRLNSGSEIVSDKNRR